METKRNSTRSFGILFFIVFFVIGVWPVFNSENLRLWSIILSFLFLISGLVNANFLNPLNRAWIKFGEILGKIIAPVVMFLIFFVLITPLSFVIRIFGKDLLKTRLSNETSYWIKREKDAGTMKRQF